MGTKFFLHKYIRMLNFIIMRIIYEFIKNRVKQVKVRGPGLCHLYKLWDISGGDFI